MKIAQFIDTDGVGGAEVMLLELSEALKDNGHEVSILHFGNAELCQRAESLGIETLLVTNHRQYKKTVTLPLFAYAFSKFLKKHNFDLIHSHLFGSITASAPAARLAGMPAVGTLHDIYIVAEKPSRAYLLKFAQIICGMKLIAVSEDMKRFYGDLTQAIDSQVIYNGIDTNKYSNKVRAKNKQIITVGRLVELKRFELIIKAMNLMPDSLAINLVIVGDGQERKSLEDLVSQLKLQEKVKFAGSQNDVTPFLNESSIFCLTSKTEGLSRSIIEAMSCHLPIVATDVGGNRELLSSGGNGLLLSANPSEKEVADAIIKIATNEKLAEEFGSASRSLACQKFSLETMLSKYLETYEVK